MSTNKEAKPILSPATRKLKIYLNGNCLTKYQICLEPAIEGHAVVIAFLYPSLLMI